MTSSLAISTVDQKRIDESFEGLELVHFIVSKIWVFNQAQDHLQLFVRDIFFCKVLIILVKLGQTLIAELVDGREVFFSAEIDNLLVDE